MQLFRMLTIAALCAASLPSLAQEDTAPASPAADAPSCFNDTIRISALIQLADKVKVGFVDARDGRNYLLSAGETAADITVIEADYEHETVVLQLGNEFCTLQLNSDPDAPLVQNEKVDETYYRGEAIERFLAEFPNAVEDGLIKFPLQAPIPPAIGRGATIEKFLSENPDMRAIADMVVTGRGPGIEAMLAEHPEFNVPVEIPEGSLGPGIEEAIRQNPGAMTNINLNFPMPEGVEP